ncbi:hypothetical protein PoB_002099300 [Plakobranchus ocellatus]|uniref:Uncharacterized protein n=1 Tax=Plakobranchus ocellatus TaxID=259542 RepID=A0AAV3ZI51_9GAST|nr:hypothetical protein PoB_002099300 [Plakobranchus ocellatus]
MQALRQKCARSRHRSIPVSHRDFMQRKIDKTRVPTRTIDKTPVPTRTSNGQNLCPNKDEKWAQNSSPIRKTLPNSSRKSNFLFP